MTYAVHTYRREKRGVSEIDAEWRRERTPPIGLLSFFPLTFIGLINTHNQACLAILRTKFEENLAT